MILMTVKNRMLEFLEHLDMSQNKFEMTVGLSTGFVNNIGDSIRTKSLEKITKVYPDLNTSWLLTGVGEMLNGENPTTEKKGSYLSKRLKKKNESLTDLEVPNASGIPVYDIPIDASFLERYREDGAAYEPIGFLKIPKLRNCNFAAIISGNSMYPILKSGTIAACRIIDNMDYFDEGEMYFISTTNGFETVKYVQSGEKPDEIKLIPHNEKIKATVIKKSMVIRMCIVEAWLNFR